MKKTALTLSLLAVVGMALPLAAAPQKGKPPKPESIIEGTADTVLLPSTANGILVVKACKTCPPRSFRATSATVYSLAGKPIGLAELKATIAKNPRMNVDITLSKIREIAIVEATPQGGNQ